jgi:hypothetical protein
LITRQVRLNHRRRFREHVLEPIEEQRVHVREVARVFVRRPSARRGAALQNTRRHFPYQWHHDLWRSTQRINNGRDAVHYR